MARDSRSKEPRKKGGLGRGIEALFEDEPQIEEVEEVKELDLSDIRPNHISQESDLTIRAMRVSDSIKENGVFNQLSCVSLLTAMSYRW